jgi:hypothetical protein
MHLIAAARPRALRQSSVVAATLTTLALCALPTTPALAAAPETPITEAATSVTGTEATLNGELNPGASATTGYEFTYGQNENCEGAATEPGAEATGQSLKVSTLVTGLEPNREYSFCVVATHTEEEVTETAAGAPVKFKTAVIAPAVDGQSTSGITPFEARLEALVNANNEATSCHFEYGPTTSYGTTIPCEPETLEGFGDQGVGATIAGLEAKTTYHFRVVLENASKEATQGTDQEVSTLTLEAPLIDSESFSTVTASGATLEAQINPNYQESTFSFEFATNEALSGATTVAGAAPLPAGFGDQAVSAPVTGLQTRTTYYYRALAQNKASEEAGKATEGAVQSFTTLATPAVTTAPAAAVTRTSAALAGTVNPSGLQSTYHFAYIADAAYKAALAEAAANPFAQGTVTPEATGAADFAPHAVGPVEVDELQPGTTYDYATVATNSLGTTIASDVQQFTTAAPSGPLAITGEASGISQLSATIAGSVDTRGLPTTVSFELGTVPGQGVREAASVSATSDTLLTISAMFAGTLLPGTTYYYRALATNSDGTSAGEERSFETPPFAGLPGIPVAEAIGWPPFVNTALAALNHPEAPLSGGGSKAPSRAQKLAKALKACAHKPKRRRAACRRAAQRKYGHAKRKGHR